MSNDFNSLRDNFVRPILLHAEENKLFAVFIIFFGVVFVLPLIKFLQNLVVAFPYIAVITFVTSFINNNFTLADKLLLCLVIAISIPIFFILYRQKDFNNIVENFDKGLTKWSIPGGARWHTERCSDRPGKMLTVEESYFPGLLKETDTWYDYEATFQAKIDGEVSGKKNIDFVIRSSNSLNGILLRLTEVDLIPHFFHNGYPIIDDKNIERLPIKLKTDLWIDIKVKVVGETVTVIIQGSPITYRIRSMQLEVLDASLVSEQILLSKLEDDSRSLNQLIEEYRSAVEVVEQKKKEQNDELNNSDENQLEVIGEQLKETKKIQVDYRKGAFGFRKDQNERMFIRKLRLKKI